MTNLSLRALECQRQYLSHAPGTGASARCCSVMPLGRGLRSGSGLTLLFFDNGGDPTSPYGRIIACFFTIRDQYVMSTNDVRQQLKEIREHIAKLTSLVGSLETS